MTESERQKTWDEFLELWPLERVEGMTLPEYTALATPDCFTACLESKTDNLGSIWGGYAFKFGIFRRKANDGEQSTSTYIYGPEYAWRAKLGSTPGEAFGAVRREVVRIINAIRARDLTAIESDILWPMAAWKIAFLYQDQENPLVVAVFKPEWIKSYLGLPGSADLSMAELNRLAMEKRGNREILEYSKEIWERGSEAARQEGKTSGVAQGLEEGEEDPEGDIHLNCILYGPPGTGKTYSTVTRALAIFRRAGMDTGANRREKLACFEKLRAEERIRFVTFHQSFSYEDFVEGIRPVPEGGGIKYRIEAGIFKSLCEAAERAAMPPTAEQDVPEPAIWKMSLGDTQKDEAWVFEECKRNNYLLMGYGGDIDFSSSSTSQEFRALFEENLPEQIEENDYPVSVVYAFVREMKADDLVIVSEGNAKFRAIGRVGDNYRVIDSDRDGYLQCRDVEWLFLPEQALPAADIYFRKFSQRTLHRLKEQGINHEALDSLLQEASSAGPQSLAPPPFVLIIDEINRGNLAAIFGELITLIEESHRANGPEPLTLTLPYSKKPFSVPGNVYIVGTMNTADRSLTRLDTALRRRFSMVAMPPKPELLAKIRIPQTSVSMGDILARMNERIAALLDRDHCIGHAPFMELENLPDAELLDKLEKTFRNYVVPLLEEYFFDDWQKIQLVLNDQRKPERERMLRKIKGAAELFGEENLPDANHLWAWNEAAFSDPLAYAHIVAVPSPEQTDADTPQDEEGGATA